MAVEDVPKDRIINERTSYFQVLYYIPLRDLYRWDDRYDYMLAVGYIPVAGQTIPPTLPPGPGSPFNAAETEFLNDNYASDAEVQGAISTAGSALGIANDAKTAADNASRLATQAGTDAGNAAGSAADAARNAANATSTAQAAQTAATNAQESAGKAIAAAGQVAEARSLASMADQWAGDKAVAQGISFANYSDSTAFAESWANLNNWVLGATTGFQVSGGRLYAGTASGGSASVANRSFALGANDKLTLKTSVVVGTGAASAQDTIVGVSSDAAGGAPTTSARAIYGVDFQHSDMTIRPWWTTRDTTGSSAPMVAGQTYYVTITIDQFGIYFSVTQANSTFPLLTGYYARNGLAVNNLAVFNNDNRQTSGGTSIGAFGAVKALTSFRTRAGYEDLSPFWLHLSDNGTYRVGVALPKNFDSRKPIPVVMAFHGSGGNANSFHANGKNNNTDMMNAFTSAGFMVVSAGYNANTQTWGADPSLLAYEYAYNYVKSYFPIGPVAFWCNSMGGIESLLTLARNNIPCSAWVGTVPTVSLLNNYNQNYGTPISTAYGIAADGSDYAEKTAGHDPNLMDVSAFRGVPMKVIIATDDASVIPEQNWNQIEERMKTVAKAVERIDVTGGHTSTALGANAPALAAFVQKYIPPVFS